MNKFKFKTTIYLDGVDGRLRQRCRYWSNWSFWQRWRNRRWTVRHRRKWRQFDWFQWFLRWGQLRRRYQSSWRRCKWKCWGRIRVSSFSWEAHFRRPVGLAIAIGAKSRRKLKWRWKSKLRQKLIWSRASCLSKYRDARHHIVSRLSDRKWPFRGSCQAQLASTRLID